MIIILPLQEIACPASKSNIFVVEWYSPIFTSFPSKKRKRENIYQNNHNDKKVNLRDDHSFKCIVCEW